MPRGNLCVKVKTEAARRRLEGQEVKILGYTFKFRERNPLDDRFYIDISGVSSDSCVDTLFGRLFDIGADTLFGRLFDIGAKPIFATNREVHLKTGITTATWRVYFFDQQAPKALVINGGIVDQLVFSKRRTGPSREAVYSTLRGWFQGQDNKGFDTHRLFDEWRALAFFELLLFVTAPHIVRSDAWVQFIARMPVEWLAHRHVRLLKTPVLLTLLRTTMGQFVFKRLESRATFWRLCKNSRRQACTKTASNRP